MVFLIIFIPHSRRLSILLRGETIYSLLQYEYGRLDGILRTRFPEVKIPSIRQNHGIPLSDTSTGQKCSKQGKSIMSISGDRYRVEVLLYQYFFLYGMAVVYSSSVHSPMVLHRWHMCDMILILSDGKTSILLLQHPEISVMVSCQSSS